MSDAHNSVELIRSKLVLPNGITVPNRLVKAAMEEGIGHSGGCPGPDHRRLYAKWGEGGWGVIITGNVQVDRRHLATAHDRYIPDHSARTVEAYASLHQSIIAASASASKSASSSTSSVPLSRPLCLVQLSHAGLQSSPIVSLCRPPWSAAEAPCAARPDMGNSIYAWLLSHALWPVKSRQLSGAGWLGVVRKFVDAARVMEDAGWGGVQVHSAHGYLLAEYLSPLTNPDPEPLLRVPAAVPLRLHLLYLILHGIARGTKKEFVKSVKVNCSDFVQGGLDETQAVKVVKEIVSWGIVDILEVSGGTYASPAFASPETISQSSTITTRQSLFAHFTTSLLPHLPAPPDGPAILLTGGMHDRQIIAASLCDRACDLVGIGRPACVYPTCARTVILNEAVGDNDSCIAGYEIRGSRAAKLLLNGGSVSGKGGGIPLVGAGVSTLWHEWQLGRIGRGLEPDLAMSWFYGLLVEMIWFGIFGGLSWATWTRKEERAERVKRE